VEIRCYRSFPAADGRLLVRLRRRLESTVKFLSCPFNANRLSPLMKTVDDGATVRRCDSLPISRPRRTLFSRELLHSVMQPTTTAARVKRGPRGSGFATFIIMYYIMRVETSILEAAADSRSREAESRMDPRPSLKHLFHLGLSPSGSSLFCRSWRFRRGDRQRGPGLLAAGGLHQQRQRTSRDVSPRNVRSRCLHPDVHLPFHWSLLVQVSRAATRKLAQGNLIPARSGDELDCIFGSHG